jgi:UPF0755 protein
MPITLRRKISIAVLLLAMIIGSVFYAYSKIYLYEGSAQNPQTINIGQGENALAVGAQLSDVHIISGKWFLVFYLWQTGQLHKIVAGAYEFAPGLKIPEIAKIITGGEVQTQRIVLTFPEGWTAKQMAERINAKGLPGDDFLTMVKNPPVQLKQQFPIIQNLPAGQSLEGYLFPDTYYFVKDATAEDIIDKMLKDFSQRITPDMLSAISGQNKTLFQIITMASIVEGEVKSDSDRKVVAGIFWKRIANGQRLQSDATLEYILGTNALQHSIAETQTNSPYNTYQNAGLPPGPVSNPSLSSIEAAIYPTDSSYNYFLTDPKTGNTIFAATYEQHLANKGKYGL